MVGVGQQVFDAYKYRYSIYAHSINIYALFCSYIKKHLKTIPFVKCLENDQGNTNSSELKFKGGRIAQKGMCKHFPLNS